MGCFLLFAEPKPLRKIERRCVMADIEIKTVIKVRLECDDCGATLVHLGAQLHGDETHISVLPCINCSVVNGRRRAAELADLQSRIKSLQVSIAKAMGMKKEPKP